MKPGIDCASPVKNPRALVAAGKRFVCRYVSTPGNPKNLTLGEKVGLLAAGLEIVVVFETTARRALKGAKAGATDAAAAAAQLAGLGLEAAPVYMAVDFDATDAQLAKVGAYFDGAVAKIGKDRVGGYGGYKTVKYLFDTGRIRYGWQTYAWSNGVWDARAQLRQVENGAHVGGLDVDLDEAYAADFGQYPAPVLERARLRRWILGERRLGRSWAWLKKTVRWKRWRSEGGH